jgi:hypothetical protein
MVTSSLNFRDINIGFKKHPVTDDIVLSKDASAIKQAIVNILLTNRGERLFNPRFGSDIRKYLFEPLDYATAAQVNGSIRDTLSKFEPRIAVRSVNTIPNFDDNGFDVEMTYEVRGSDVPPVNVEFFLARTR